MRSVKDAQGVDEIRIPLERRRGKDGKPFYLAHLPIGTTVLVFTQCNEPVLVLKKTTSKKTEE